MAVRFAQQVKVVGALGKILEDYPFATGIFHELIQNSEDAGAKKQVFVLDRRTYDSEGLCHAGLAAAQGPALLAYNDAYFKDKDWTAIQETHESSKSNDMSKIGKFGLGFRSVFHLTDCPQIISGGSFALCDPLKTFTGSEGLRFDDVGQLIADHPGQLSSFKHFTDEGLLEEARFKGTVIRCPLRIAKGNGISKEVVGPDRLHDLFATYVKESLELSLLFLEKLEQVTIIDVDEEGEARTLASLNFERSSRRKVSEECYVYSVTSNLSIDTQRIITKSWNIVSCPFDGEQAKNILAKSVDETVDIESALLDHKLRPHITIAALSDLSKARGRFFTYLPLPLHSSFGIHISAIFALTLNRQNFANTFEVVRNSQDHIRMEWNKILFNNFIPRAWKEYLEYLVQQGNLSAQSLFDSWPTPTSSEGRNIPLHLFETALASRSPIWPLIGNPDAKTVFKPLQDVLVAKQTQKKTAEALSVMGLEVVVPPAYIFDFVSASQHVGDVTLLSPEEAHRGLLPRVAQFQNAASDTLRQILEYLLSTGNCLNLVGLPLIPTSSSSGMRLSLEPMVTSSELHTVLDSSQARIFGFCDDKSISISSLPSRAGAVLLDKGPGVLNVVKLTNSRIVQYLQYYLTHLDPSIRDGVLNREVITWLSTFWEWFGTWAEKKALRHMLEEEGLTLIPCMQGLKSITSPVFKAKGMQPLPVRQLTTMGISFLHWDLTSTAHEELASLGLLKQMSNIHDLLDAFPAGDNIPQPPADVCGGILKHLSAYATASCNIRGPFTAGQIEKLKRLPIFPVLAQSSGGTSNVDRTFRAIQDTTVRPVRRPPFLPTIDDVLFVEADLIGSLLTFITERSDRLDDNGLLSLSCDHFLSQTTQFQAAVLEHIIKKQGNLTPQWREKLANIAFVAAEDGSFLKPGDVVDPDSVIACLFPTEPSVRPRLDTEPQRSIIASLRNLKFLKSLLTPPLIADRAIHISRHHASPHAIIMSENLLQAMCSETYIDLSSVAEIKAVRWLPTERGLQSPDETRDNINRADLPRHLFDRVLAMLDPRFSPSPYLRHYFGWNNPLPCDILIQQLVLVLDSADSEQNGQDIYNIVGDILDILSEYEPSVSERLADVLDEKSWVPTTAGTLVSIHDAAFEVPFGNSGFTQISVRPSTKRLLLDLGCTDQPTTGSILLKLQHLKERTPSLAIVKSSVILLQSLPDVLSPQERDAVLVPDTNCNLQLIQEIRFNDIANADNANLIPDRGPLAHPLITDEIAQKLDMERLGLNYDYLNTPDVQMGADPLRQVQRVLEEYTEGQFLIEFVANAVDAGATCFNVSLHVPQLDDPSYARQQVLSPSTMQGLLEAPSLVIHNNSVFSERDFQGIRETSVGGKKGSTDTIGQFGFGAATMFYFTEVALIVSGGYALFLNPSGELLPNRRTVIRLPLEHVRRFYPSHLLPANGQFGFDISQDTQDYNGTIFILPLRTVTQMDISSHSRFAHSKTWDEGMIIQNVIKPFATSAPNCLIFTKLSEISAIGHWNFIATHHPIYTEQATGYTVHDVQISADNSYNPSTWKVASVAVSKDAIRPNVPRPSVHTRDTIAGLAARLPGESPGQRKPYSFFSTLPLQITTSVPVHISASFILSSDRRNIRLDEYSNSETAYNRWLLGELIPPLYLFLLERLALDLDVSSNILKRWWPGYRDATDNISRHLIKSFYGEHLPQSIRTVFISEFADFHPHQHRLLTPAEAVLTGTEPPHVRQVLARLQPRRLVQLSEGSRQRALDEAKLSAVSPLFLREEIEEKVSQFHSLFSLNQDPTDLDNGDGDMLLNVRDLEQIISYLDDRTDQNENLLEGLAILPLSDHNHSFGTFGPESSAQVYFSMPKATNTLDPIPHNFPPLRFVHSGIKHKTLMKLRLNVVQPTPDHLLTLIEEKIPQSNTLEHPSNERVEWIRNFWDLFGGYQQLGLTWEHIQAFPLVPTIQPHVFVSLLDCKGGTSLVMNSDDLQAPDDQIRRALIQLDALAVVERDSPTTPPALRDILESSNLREMGPLEKVLKAFENKPPELVNAEFEGVEDVDEARSTLAEWIRVLMDRSFVLNALPADAPQVSVARLLPIWPSASKADPEIKLRPADEIHLLPPGVRLSQAVHYLNECMSDHPSLHRLKGPRFEYSDIARRLDLPVSLADTQLSDYRSFLVTWLYHLPTTDSPPSTIFVPNTTMQLCDASTLYARSPLFVAAFGQDDDRFVSPLFSELESRLSEFGMKTEDELDVDLFRQCVVAIDGIEDNHDRRQRAASIFGVFCNRMAVIALDQDDVDILRQFDNYEFIPRAMTHIRRLPGMGVEHGLDISLDGDLSNRVLSPSRMVREEFEAVAWSQRARFENQPDRRVLSVYRDLGKPTMTEVVNHLKYLSELTPNGVQQRKIIAHDAKASYNFLMANLLSTSEQEENGLPHDIRDEAIFLNINDEEDVNDAWTWLKGTQLVFNAADAGGLFSVKGFLTPFQSLLTNVGALSVYKPSVERTVVVAPEGQLQEFKNAFDAFRRNQKFVDVVFEAKGEEDGETLRFWAHRSFLSICSPYFATMFDGGLGESRNDASAASPIILPNPSAADREFYAPCVEHILDYIYSAIPLLPGGLSVDTLLEMLELANLWEMVDLAQLIQEEIILEDKIQPHDVDAILDRALHQSANILADKCMEYKEKNEAYINFIISQTPQ